MIRASDIRAWTTFAIIGLSFFTARQALDVAAFGWNFLLTDEDNARERMTPYADTPSAGYLARKSLLQFAPDADAAGRVDEIAGLLARVPMASYYWLQYARAQFEAGGPAAKVVAALALSNLAGPNEAWIAARRVSFTLPIWTVLPPDSRRILISDLTGPAHGNLDETHRYALKATLRAASAKTREEIRSALLLAGKKGEAIATSLELDHSRSNSGPAPLEKDSNTRSGAKGDPATLRPPPSLPAGALSPAPFASPSPLRPATQ